MTRKLVVFVCGGALALTLAGAASPALARASARSAGIAGDSGVGLDHGPALPPDPW